MHTLYINNHNRVELYATFNTEKETYSGHLHYQNSDGSWVTYTNNMFPSSELAMLKIFESVFADQLKIGTVPPLHVLLTKPHSKKLENMLKQDGFTRKSQV